MISHWPEFSNFLIIIIVKNELSAIEVQPLHRNQRKDDSLTHQQEPTVLGGTFPSQVGRLPKQISQVHGAEEGPEGRQKQRGSDPQRQDELDE